MSLAWPTTKTEANRAAWVFASWFVVPQLVFIALFWKVYFTEEAHLWSLAASLLLAVPLVLVVIRRASYMANAGIHPHFKPGHRFSVKFLLIAWLGGACGLYFSALLLLSLHLFVAGDKSARVAVVEKSGECKRRCLGCAFTADVRNERLNAQVCADSLTTRPSVGSKVVLEGKYSKYAQFVSSVEQ